MLVKQAREIARQWVIDEAGRMPGFYGAFFAGSTNGLPDDATLAESSDVDVMVVLAGPMPSVKLGKFIYRDRLLEVTYLPRDQLLSSDQILGDSYGRQFPDAEHYL